MQNKYQFSQNEKMKQDTKGYLQYFWLMQEKQINCNNLDQLNNKKFNYKNQKIALIAMLQQFKNAIHMSKIATESSNPTLLQFSPKKTNNKSSDKLAQSSHFGSLAFSRHFKEAQQKSNKFKSWIDGIGITIDDMGHLIIGQWKNNQIEGKYFVFKPNLVEQNDQHQIYSAICQYGNMKAGQLDSDNYIYNISGTLAKGEYQCNKIIGRCLIIHSNKLFLANQLNKVDKIQCQVVNCSTKENQKKDIDNPNLLKIPKINTISKSKQKSTFQSSKSSANFQQIEPNTFIKPNKFLQDMILSNQSKQNKQSLAYIGISQRQYFIGFLHNEKKQQKSTQTQNEKRNSINGFGVIFKNEWPSNYGSFKEGKLYGLGRVYETQMNLLDGYFMNGQLMEGFIIDYYANTISFGHHSSLDTQFKKQNEDKSCFITTNTFQTASLDYIVEYRRNFHLKSLYFNNSYFNAPKLIHRSPWPYNIINKLYKRTHIETIIKSFRPTLRDVQISLIQKGGQSSDNRIEKELIQEIKESKLSAGDSRSKLSTGENRSRLSKEKNSLIQNQISKNLISKGQVQTEDLKLLPTYYKQYMKIQKKQKQLIQAKKAKQTQKKSTIKNHQRSIKDSSQALTQHRTPQKTPPLNLNFNKTEQDHDKALDLTDLVNEYHQCQTAKKSSTGNTTRSINTDRKVSPRQIYSKRQLIKLDHDNYMGKKEMMPIKQYPNSRRKVDLDLIYREYLHK